MTAALAEAQWGPASPGPGIQLAELPAGPAAHALQPREHLPLLSPLYTLLQPSCMGAELSGKAAAVLSKLHAAYSSQLCTKRHSWQLLRRVYLGLLASLRQAFSCSPGFS